VCVVLFHRLCCDAIIHLTVSCSHFFFFLVWFFFSAKDSSSADVAGWPSYISSNPHHVNHDLIGFFHVLRQPVGLFFFWLTGSACTYRRPCWDFRVPFSWTHLPTLN
jgi:hypothetical protein